jgi:MYXO-CTERM domain-containing protein
MGLLACIQPAPTFDQWGDPLLGLGAATLRRRTP